jgi:thioredoxin-like negative regulator of GroEL
MVLEARTSSGKVIPLIVLSCVSIVAAWFIIHPWVAVFAIPPLPHDPDLLRAWRSHPEHLQHQHQYLGRIRQYGISSQNYQEALKQYRMALQENPLSSRTWFDVARVHWWLGQVNEAKAALRFALRFNPSNSRLRWEAALFQIQLEDYEGAVANLRHLVTTEPHQRQSYFTLIHTLMQPADFIDTTLPAEAEILADYLDYLIRQGDAENGRTVWRRLTDLRPAALNARLALSYVDMMLERKDLSEATAAWDLLLRSRGMSRRGGGPDNVVWNGGFERDETWGAGFDWRVGRSAGVEIGVSSTSSTEGTRSLKMTFDGTRNPDLTTASQVVPVTPGSRYLLSSSIKTTGITTSSGPYLEVRDFLDGRRYAVSESYIGDHPWSEVRLTFEASPHAQAIVIKIRREASQKLDNLIKGTAWIDQVDLRKIH